MTLLLSFQDRGLLTLYQVNEFHWQKEVHKTYSKRKITQFHIKKSKYF